MKKLKSHYGLLTVVSEDIVSKLAFVKCICGKEKHINRYNLARNIVLSCGCRGLSHISLHTRRVWTLMRYRCNKYTSHDYHNYGGRGIKVCDEWNNSVINFYNDMGNCPVGYSIDRIDVDGNYSKENCRWADSKMQSNNKRNTRYITYNGETKSLALFAEEYGIKFTTLRERLNRGWSISDALKRDIDYKKGTRKLDTKA